MVVTFSNTTLGSISVISWLLPEKDLRWLYVYIYITSFHLYASIEVWHLFGLDFLIIEVLEIPARDPLISGTYLIGIFSPVNYLTCILILS